MEFHVAIEICKLNLQMINKLNCTNPDSFAMTETVVTLDILYNSFHSFYQLILTII